MNDLKPFEHGSEGTHSTCRVRLKREGQQATCCFCDPHVDCTINNPDLDLARAPMKTVTIAFDIDGTLLNNEQTGVDGLGNPAIITLAVLLSKMKNTRLIAWSGGGAEYSETICRQLNITKYFKGFYSKISCPEVVDIAIDDIQESALAPINLIVREK